MAWREVVGLAVAGTGGALLTEAVSTVRTGRAVRKARRDGDQLRRLDDHVRVAKLEDRMRELRTEVAEFRELLITVLTKDPER